MPHPLGRRVSTTDMSGTVYHAYDGIHCVADLDGDGGLLRAYTWGAGVDNLLAVTFYNGESTNTLYAVTDPLGTVHAMVASDGTIAVSYTYDSWGNVLSVSGDQALISANRFTWQGREYSYATGLYNFRARWYDPAAGRWLSKDPIGLEGGLNLYEAFGNNPVCFGDPLGETVYYSSLGGTHAELMYTDSQSSTGYDLFNFYGQQDAHWPGKEYTVTDNIQEVINAFWSKGVLVVKSEPQCRITKDYITIHMTSDEEKRLHTVIASYEVENYSVIGNNCSTVIRKVLYECGFFSSPHFTGWPITPDGLQKDIEE